MACCAVAAYIIWRLVSLHDRLFHQAAPREPDLGAFSGKTMISERGKETTILDQYCLPEQDGAVVTSSHHSNTNGSSLRTCILSVKGITCSACVRQIQSALNSFPAVKSAQVSLVLLRARVEYNSLDASPADLVSVIQHAGYEAREISSTACRRSIHDVVSALVESDAAWRHSVEQVRHEFLSSMALCIFIVSIPYVSPWLGASGTCILFALQTAAALACLLISRRVHFQAMQSLIRGGPRTVATLVSAGMITAFIEPLLSLVMDSWRVGNPLRAIHLVTSNSMGSMASLCTIVLGGQLMKIRSSRRSLGQSARLASLFPQSAAVVSTDNGLSPSSVGVGMLEPGDTVNIREGERLPADGKVLSGTAYVDQNWMTGDSQPVRVEPGNRVFTGYSVTEGQIVVLIEHCGMSSRLGKFLEHVSTSELEFRTTPAETESSIFVDIILFLVLAATFAWRIIGLPWEECFQRMVSMLVCACPCTLELGVPISLISAAASAAKANIQLSTRPDRLENVADVKTVLLDKTGTLTTGKLSVSWRQLSPVWNVTKQKQEEWWALVGAIEQHAGKHPVALAIAQESEAQRTSAFDTKQPRVSVIRARPEPGKGVQGWVALDDKPPVHVAVGSKGFLGSLGITPNLSSVPEAARSDVGTIVCVAIDQKYAGILLCRDTVRCSARRLVQCFSHRGVRVGMITGDSWSAALLVARSVGMSTENVHAEMLPLDKAQVVRASRQQGPVMVVGDNINDTAAFSESSFSVYVGSEYGDAGGTDASLLPLAAEGFREAAFVRGNEASGTVAKDPIDLENLRYMTLLARKTVGKIRQNKMLSMAYNMLALTLASGVLQKINHHLVFSPIMASLGMGLNSALVLWNASRVELSSNTMRPNGLLSFLI